MTQPTIVRAGGKPPGKAGPPFTILIVANPYLESPWTSGTFVPDPIMGTPPAFAASVTYVNTVLFGGLVGQREILLGDPSVAPYVRVLSLMPGALPPEDANSFVGEDGVSNLLVARRNAIAAFVSGLGITADVVYAVSGSTTHTRATAWFTTDDDTKAGIPFTLNATTLAHRFFYLIPGTVALPVGSTSLTALHEFGHAISSYSNGRIVDLYVDSAAALNCAVGRPIPPGFATYNGHGYASDPVRDSLGYPPGWTSYHCELLDPARPAVMDDYWLEPSGTPELCLHDAITRAFVMDRIRAKVGR